MSVQPVPFANSEYLRIATWNVQRPSPGDDVRWAFLESRIREINADIWILTESHQSLSPGSSYQGVFTDQMTGMLNEGECRTAIWSRIPIRKTAQTHDPETAVCIEAETRGGPMLVYGTVIPYHQAGAGSRPYRSGLVDVSGKRLWELHYESIERHKCDLISIMLEHPRRHLCFGGDFNQSRDGRAWTSGRQWYGTRDGRILLSECLKHLGLCCVTEKDFVGAGSLASRSSVDHLCINGKLAAAIANVDAWEADLLIDKRISDHNGVFVDFDWNQLD